MTNEWSCLSHLSDRELLEEVQTLATRERDATARLIASLMEIDSRRLYLGQGCSSLFTFCTQVLRLSEHAAYARIEAARAARRLPIVLDQLADGSVTLTAVCLLAPYLTPRQLPSRSRGSASQKQTRGRGTGRGVAPASAGRFSRPQAAAATRHGTSGAPLERRAPGSCRRAEARRTR
jgi:hypothetical protein